MNGTSIFQTSLVFQRLSRAAGRLSLGSLISQERILSLTRGLLVILLFSSAFMPYLLVGSIDSFRIELRGEDVMLPAILVFLFWSLMKPKVSSPEVPSVERAFLWFLLAAEMSIFSGFFLRTIDKPLGSLLYLLKWIEYFLIFIVTVRLTEGEKSEKLFLSSFFLLGIAVAGYGYWEQFFPAPTGVHFHYYRLFERFPFHGSANHIGGLFVVWLGFFTGLFLKTENRRERVVLLISLLFVFVPLLWTYSRKSYFALAGMLGLAFFIPKSRKKLLFLAALFTILGLVLPTRLSDRLTELGETFSSSDPFHSSWAGNWVQWKRAFWNFDRLFLFGSGLGSRHRLFYESQYVLTLAEMGLLGFSAFVYLGLTLIREGAARLRLSLTAREKGIALGWLLGFAGLLIHSTSCVSWTVSKVGVPFWFLSGLVMVRKCQK